MIAACEHVFKFGGEGAGATAQIAHFIGVVDFAEVSEARTGGADHQDAVAQVEGIDGLIGAYGHDVEDGERR